MPKDAIQAGIDKQQAISDQISARELTGTTGWQWYYNKLEEIELNYVHQLIHSPKEEHDHLAGLIQGMRMAYNLPNRLLKRQID